MNMKNTDNLRFWCHKILPLVYDDSLSYYELLCKVVARLNELGEIVAELADIRNVIDAQLTVIVDELLREMIKNGEFEGIIDETLLNTKVNRYKAKFAVVGGVTPQDLMVVKLYDKTMLIDCGLAGDTIQFSNVCRELGVDKIDYIYISHYHEDHAGNIENIANVIDITGATVYCPVKPNQNYASSGVIGYYDLVMRVCSANNCNVVHPTEGLKYDLTIMENITFYNTDSTPYENDNYNYNNCSLCAALSVCDTIVWFDGDLQKEGQAIVVTKDIPCNVLVKKMSHHGTTPAGVESYFNKLNPQYVFATDGNGLSTENPSTDVLSAWGYETTLYDRGNVPTFATSSAKNYIMYFDVGERYFGCYTPRYMYKRISPYNTSLAFIAEGYSDIARTLSIEDIIEKMPNSYLEFHAPAGWASCPASYLNGVHWRIWKNNSANTQDWYGYESNEHYALAIMTEHSGWVKSEDTTLVMYFKSPETENKWRCSVTSLSGTNFVLALKDNITPGTGINISFIEGYKGNDFVVKENALVCDNEGVYRLSVYCTLYGVVDNEYTIRIRRVRDGVKTDALVAAGKKQIDGSTEKYSSTNAIFLNQGDIINIDLSGNVEKINVRLLLEAITYTNKVGREQFLNA